MLRSNLRVSVAIGCKMSPKKMNGWFSGESIFRHLSPAGLDWSRVVIRAQSQIGYPSNGRFLLPSQDRLNIRLLYNIKDDM